MTFIDLMWIILFVLMSFALGFGALMYFNAFKLKPDNAQMINRLDAILPQTQCRQCGYAGCKPYAVAIVSGEADINQCPPGGEVGAKQLAKLMRLPYKPINPKNGVEKPKAIAFIIEEACIGCTLCIQACPVDAILGASKTMHTVLSDECTGCELCLPPCPMDCIVMEPILKTPNALSLKAQSNLIESITY